MYHVVVTEVEGRRKNVPLRTYLLTGAYVYPFEARKAAAAFLAASTGLSVWVAESKLEQSELSSLQHENWLVQVVREMTPEAVEAEGRKGR